MGCDVGAEHRWHQKPGISKPVGRPTKPQKKRRKRLDGWNQIVAMHKPICATHLAGAAIKSGEHMKELAEWRAKLSEVEKHRYREVAMAGQVAAAAASDDESDEAGEVAEDAAVP